LLKIIELCEKKYTKGNVHSLNSKNNESILDILIATKLSQNTTDKTAFIAFNNLKRKYGKLEKLMEERINKIRDEIRICGMANTKAKDIKKILKKIYKKYKSFDLSFLNNYSTEEIYNQLLELNGVGIKTASCVIAFGLHRDVFPVDTHIHRVLNRIGIVKTKTPEKTFFEVSDKIPEGKKLFFHKCLIKFGRSICKAKNPLCNECFLYIYCKYKYKLKYKNKKVQNLNPQKYDFLILENIK